MSQKTDFQELQESIERGEIVILGEGNDGSIKFLHSYAEDVAVALNLGVDNSKDNKKKLKTKIVRKYEPV